MASMRFNSLSGRTGAVSSLLDPKLCGVSRGPPHKAPIRMRRGGGADLCLNVTKARR